MNASTSKRGARQADSPIAHTALYLEVARRLRERILARELAPGAWIDEQALTEAYGISRTPLREALKVLAAEGLVTLKPRRGCYVTEVSERDLDDIYPVLAHLEGLCAREAVRRSGPADLERLQRIHDDLERHAAKADVARYFEANQAFHEALQALSGNRWLRQIIDDMRRVLRLVRHDSLFLQGRLAESLDEHRAIMAALEAGDAAAAEDAMRLHLLSGRAALARHRIPASVAA